MTSQVTGSVFQSITTVNEHIQLIKAKLDCVDRGDGMSSSSPLEETQEALRQIHNEIEASSAQLKKEASSIHEVARKNLQERIEGLKKTEKSLKERVAALPEAMKVREKTEKLFSLLEKDRNPKQVKELQARTVLFIERHGEKMPLCCLEKLSHWLSEAQQVQKKAHEGRKKIETLDFQESSTPSATETSDQRLDKEVSGFREEKSTEHKEKNTPKKKGETAETSSGDGRAHAKKDVPKKKEKSSQVETAVRDALGTSKMQTIIEQMDKIRSNKSLTRNLTEKRHAIKNVFEKSMNHEQRVVLYRVIGKEAKGLTGIKAENFGRNNLLQNFDLLLDYLKREAAKKSV